MTFIQRFFKLEAASGIILMLAALAALVAANTPASEYYEAFLTYEFYVKVGGLTVSEPVTGWINDALMAVFFLLIGLEIKREIVEGELSTRKQAALPFIGALGGVIIPAFIYFGFTTDNEQAAGWAIPTATDIAFSLGVLALLGSRVPLALKVFLMALAVIDDLAAVLISAIFYTSGIVPTMLLWSLALLLAFTLLNRFRVQRLTPYLLLGIVLWACVHASGVHATVAGVLLALFIPLKTKDADGVSPSNRLENALHPWVAYGIVPLFAFANAGVMLTDLSLEDLTKPVTLGIAVGLFAGKQFGIFSFLFLAVKLKWASLPEGVNWMQMHGVCILAGIGFTMSLFIGMLAFPSEWMQVSVRLGVLMGSLASALAGYALLTYALRKPAV